MSDKTVPADADDYKNDDKKSHVNTRDSKNDKLVRQAKSGKGEIPNRDEDEFTKDHLKEPEIDIETEEKINENDDNR